MFIERKTSDIGGGKFVASYEIVDDHRNRVQLTPQETETLYQYLASKSAQIHNDVNGEVVEDLAVRRQKSKRNPYQLSSGFIQAVVGETEDNKQKEE